MDQPAADNAPVDDEGSAPNCHGWCAGWGAARARWGGMGRRRKVRIVVLTLIAMALLLRWRGTPLVQVNVRLTFRPVAAVAAFGEAHVDASTRG